MEATFAANTMIPLHAISQGIHSMWFDPFPMDDRTRPFDAAVMSATENEQIFKNFIKTNNAAQMTLTWTIFVVDLDLK
jgi:hypothetical protein